MATESLPAAVTVGGVAPNLIEEGIGLLRRRWSQLAIKFDSSLSSL